jgi:hypothetical protein
MPGHGGRRPHSSRRARRLCARRRRERLQACHVRCSRAPRAPLAPRRGQARRRSRARPGRPPRRRGPGAARGAAPEVSGKEHERLRREEQLAVFDVVAVDQRRGDDIATHSCSKGRRSEPRKGEEAEGRPLRGEDDGLRPSGRAATVPLPLLGPSRRRRRGRLPPHRSRDLPRGPTLVVLDLLRVAHASRHAPSCIFGGWERRSSTSPGQARRGVRELTPDGAKWWQVEDGR